MIRTFHFSPFHFLTAAMPRKELASRPGAAPGPDGFGSNNREAIPRSRRQSLSLAKPDNPSCTAGAATYNFNDENSPRSALEVEDPESNSGELPQGTRPAFLLSLFRRPERKRNLGASENHSASRNNSFGRFRFTFIIYKERTPLPLLRSSRGFSRRTFRCFAGTSPKKPF